jgi:biopolymer transport protein ExbD
MKFPRFLILTQLVLVFPILVHSLVQETHQSARPIELTVEKPSQHLVYRLRNRTLQTADALTEISKLHTKDRDSTIDVFVSEKLNFVDMSEVLGIAEKAGFQKTRIFVVNSQSTTMVEIKFCGRMPRNASIEKSSCK